jgi:hypothetical protein
MKDVLESPGELTKFDTVLQVIDKTIEHAGQAKEELQIPDINVEFLQQMLTCTMVRLMQPRPRGLNSVASQQLVTSKPDFDSKLLSSSVESLARGIQTPSQAKAELAESFSRRKQSAAVTMMSHKTDFKTITANKSVASHFKSTERLASSQVDHLRFNKSQIHLNKDMEALDLSDHSLAAASKDKKTGERPPKMTEKATMSIKNHISRL